MSNAETVYQYSAEKELFFTTEPENKLLVADSWLVHDGCVRALHLHRQRFFSSCIELAVISPEPGDRQAAANRFMVSAYRTGRKFILPCFTDPYPEGSSHSLNDPADRL